MTLLVIMRRAEQRREGPPGGSRSATGDGTFPGRPAGVHAVHSQLCARRQCACGGLCCISSWAGRRSRPARHWHKPRCCCRAAARSESVSAARARGRCDTQQRQVRAHCLALLLQQCQPACVLLLCQMHLPSLCICVCLYICMCQDLYKLDQLSNQASSWQQGRREGYSTCPAAYGWLDGRDGG